VTHDLDAKLQRISDRVQARAVTARDELEAIGFLAEAGHLRERLGGRLVYLKTPRLEQGDPALMRPGVVGWTQYIPPKTKVRDASGQQGSRPARAEKGRDSSGEGSSGGLLGGEE
jgi:hypothetical protein